MCLLNDPEFIKNIFSLNFLPLDMVYLDENKATCRILDQHPNTTQRKLSFLVNPAKTVSEFLEQVSTQFTYDKFELILEATNVSLSDCFCHFNFS